MASYYFDTSALGKRYHQEVGSLKVEKIFQEQGAQIFISRLAGAEIHSAFATKVRTQVISEADFHLLIRLFQTDVARRILKVSRILTSHFQEAEKLLRKHSMTKSFRALDAIQLAAAMDLIRQGKVDHFVCADHRLCVVAQDEGISVINPEIP